MATRTRTGYVDNKGKIHSIYTHNDGYPSWNGRILGEHYTTLAKVKALVKLGDVSSLAESIECPAGHSFDTRVEGYTTFYTRDRGEKTSKNISANRDIMHDEEYGYLFENGQWTVFDHGQTELPLSTYKDKDGKYHDDPVDND
jgi:hypothetical protein